MTKHDVKERIAVMKMRIAMSIGCLMVVGGLTCFFCLKTRPVTVPIDKYVDNLDKAREAADNARREWEAQWVERRANEIVQLKGENIPDLSKRAVGVLARSADPQFVVNKAIVTTEKEMDTTITRPPWSKGHGSEDNKRRVYDVP